jgi:ankyrin repeat protein
MALDFYKRNDKYPTPDVLKQAIDEILNFKHNGDEYINLMYENFKKLLSLLSKEGLNKDYINKIFERSGLTGNIEIIKYLISKGATKFHFALERVVFGGNLEIVKYLIDLIESYISHSEIYDSIIEEDPDIFDEIFDNALEYAIKGGNLEIVKYLIDLIEKKYGENATFLNDMLSHAVGEENMEIFEYLIDLIEKRDGKGANHFNSALSSAAEGGNMEIVKYLIEKYGATDFNYALKLAAASFYENLELIKYLVDLIEKRDEKRDGKDANDFNEAIYEATISRNFKIVQYLKDVKGTISY